MKQIELKNISEITTRKIKEIKNFENFSHEPFTHFFIDDFFDIDFADKLLNSFPSLDSDNWDKSNDPEIEIKMRSAWTSEFDIPENIVDAIRSI